MHIDSTEQVVFYILGAVAILAALGVVFSGDIVHSALFLVATLALTAGVYVLLSAEFLSLVQILVYGGGVSILVMFAVMITRVRGTRHPLDGAQKPFGLVAGLALVAVLITMVVSTTWGGPETRTVAVTEGGAPSPQPDLGEPKLINRVTTVNGAGQVIGGTDAIGHDLFRTYAVPFEVASLVLLVALIGAIILARGEEDDVVA